MLKKYSNWAEHLNKIAEVLENQFLSENIKTAGLTYRQWLYRLRKRNVPKKVYEAFKGRWKGALEHAKKKKLKNPEEYAARTAIDGLPEKYLDNPSKYHGKGKTGPINN